MQIYCGSLFNLQVKGWVENSIWICIFILAEGSLDGPVEIMTGKRERKKVERLSMQSPPEKEKEKFEIKEGRGIKLGDCPMGKFSNNEQYLGQKAATYALAFIQQLVH